VKSLTNAPVPTEAAADPADQVTALYQAHALGLLRLAVMMLGERQAAEDVVQDAFLGLFRRWGSLNDPERALAYVRSSVFNGCRTVLRKRARNRQFVLADPAQLDPSTGCDAPTDPVYPGLAEVSLTGDRLARVHYEVKPGCVGGTATVLWSSPSGGTVLGTVNYTEDPSTTEHRVVVLYSHGTVTTISWPGAVSTLLANEAAF
jgi:hypothetical protein